MAAFKSGQEIYAFAIREEERAAAMYADLAQRAKQQHVREMFSEFAEQEREHKEILIRAQQSGGLRPSAEDITDLGIAELMEEVEMSPDLDYQQILQYAMQREKAAYDMYSALAEIATSQKLRQTLEALAQEEAKHKLRIETEYDQLVLTEN
ncbi:MAG: ferritin family protein [Deltaproteobacteria bacterium]|nr:ferritin family protein [Deltaproteobacteria bacterium]